MLQNKNSFYDLSSTYIPAPDPNNKLVPITSEDLNLAKVYEVKKSKRIHYGQDGLSSYPMQTQNRGVLLMVNIIDFPNKELERPSAKNDSECLLHLFLEFGYTCFSYHNLTKKHFFDISRKLRKSEYLEKTESFFLVVMSHGEMENMHDRVQFSDGKMCKVDKIEDLFSETKCKSLSGKPKVMVFPFCRHASENRPENKMVDCWPSVYKPQSVFSDILVCYGTIRGFQSWLDIEKGSNFIQEFCETLAEHAHDTHLENMLKMIGKKLKDKDIQIPAFYNYGFDKLLYFNPGIHICET
ncbi:caspase Dronc-like [Episyrphus balteatus]|uniref:caspase Dronc-like n=1 Tax=Episyrphus balteatus TaxID=286459 RepID=UPI002484E133|nr:caspase Dronc-like [Episyrphus balteatus]